MNSTSPYGPRFTRLCRALGDLSGLEEYARKQEAAKPIKRRRFRNRYETPWWKYSTPHGSKMHGEPFEDPPDAPVMEPTLRVGLFEAARRR